MDDRPVRVLHVIKGLGPGGAERLLVSLASVDPSGIEHAVAYLLPWKDHLVPSLRDAQVEVHLLAGRQGLRDPRWPLRLRRLARAFDIVHLHSPAVAAIARPAVRLQRHAPALVSTEHNRWASHALPTRVANALTTGLDRARWAVSQEVVDSMWRPWARSAELLVHGIPVDEVRGRRDERSGARAAQGWSDGEVVVAIVANLRPQKDYPTLLAAARQAIDADGRLRYVSIGQGPLEDELRDAVERGGFGDRFVLLGYHPDPPAVLAGADVFTLSSRHEGLPISLLEAMALGLPPVVTAVGGIPEVVTDGRDGLLVPPSDPGALAAAHLRLADDPALRRRLGEAATERAAAFDIRRTAAVLATRYREVAGRTRS